MALAISKTLFDYILHTTAFVLCHSSAYDQPLVHTTLHYFTLHVFPNGTSNMNMSLLLHFFLLHNTRL